MCVKNRTPEQKQTGVVYKIPCEGCPEVCVGETKRTLKVKLSEHRQAVKQGDPRTVLHIMFRRSTTESTGKAPQSKEGPKGSG